jgi:predicted transcriptional regulator
MSRFTIEFTDDVDKQIEQIAKALNANTKADVIRKALGLLNYVVQERAAGSTVILENKRENVRKEVVTL